MKKRIQKYIILLGQVLGSGTFGTVYKGYHETTEQLVAVKTLSKNKINVSDYVRQALRLEIKILQRIQSQHIVSFKDVIQTANNYYIIQEYCNGGDFGSYLKIKGKLKQQQAIQFMAQMLKGFYSLIKKGIVHRDMKPENILLHNGQLKIADFGLAKPTHSSVFLESNVGTPMYQSPQLLASQKYTYKCDVWALGIIFYYMLYHKHPWRTGANFISHLENIRNNQVVFPQSPEVSEQVKKFIMHCLQFQESNRADWQYIFSSPVFAGKLPKYEKLKDTFNYIVTELRKNVHESNLNLKNFFKAHKIGKGSSMRIQEFSVMIKKIVPQIDEQQIDYFFTQFDRNRNGKIGFDEFQKCLSQNEIKMQINQKQELKKVVSWCLQNQNLKSVLEEKIKYMQICEKVRKHLQDNQIYDIYDLFLNLDIDQGGFLSMQQIGKMLRQVDKTIDQDQIKTMFDAFDQNKDSKISFRQFYKHMCLITGTPFMEQKNLAKSV